MTKTGTVGLHKIGIVFAVGGIILMLLTFLDYLQDGKAEGGIIAVEVLLIIIGFLFYMSGRKSKEQNK